MKMILKTKVNANGNYKTLIIDFINKTYERDYNTRPNINDIVAHATKTEIEQIIKFKLKINGFKEV